MTTGPAQSGQNVGRRSVRCKAICRTAQADPTSFPLGSLPDGGLSLPQQGSELRFDVGAQEIGAGGRQMRSIHINEAAVGGKNRAYLRITIPLEWINYPHIAEGPYGLLQQAIYPRVDLRAGGARRGAFRDVASRDLYSLNTIKGVADWYWNLPDDDHAMASLDEREDGVLER